MKTCSYCGDTSFRLSIKVIYEKDSVVKQVKEICKNCGKEYKNKENNDLAIF